MDKKIILIFIFLFLTLLLWFQYFKIESNIVVLLSIILILLINKLLIQKEYFI